MAEVLADAGRHVIFAVEPGTVSTVPALATSGFEVCILDGSAGEPEGLGAIARGRADVLVLDRYDCERSFERACRAWARHVVVLDDNTGRQHDCDILVDAAEATGAHYADNVPSHARVLVGPSLALIRGEFVTQRSAALDRRDGRPVRNMLLSFGATNSKNLTVKTLEAIADIVCDIGITVALSSNAPHLDDVRGRAGRNVRLKVDPPDMATLISAADLAIGAGGVSGYERAVLGLPTLLVAAAENQKGVCRMMAAAGAALDAGCIDEELPVRLKALTADMLGNPAARKRMAQAAAALVDGRGARRLFVAMGGDRVTRTGVHVRLRLVEENDEHWILKLQTEPDTRRFARNHAVPTVEEHHRWMKRMLESRESILMVVEASGKDVGTIRLDRQDGNRRSGRYEISIAISSAWQSQGIGSAALSLVRGLQPQAILDAEVLPENDASRCLFAGAGYVHLRENLYRNLPEGGFDDQLHGAR